MGTTRFWTNQTIESWEYAQIVGYLVGNPDFIWEEMIENYHWKMEQMKKRLPLYDGEYPIWVWPEKPDLRRGGHFNKGTRAVCLEVEIPSRHVLLSCFDAWHCVLNDGFLALHEEERDAYYANQLIMTKEESWERIFEYEMLRNEPWWKDTKLYLQGVCILNDIN